MSSFGLGYGYGENQQFKFDLALFCKQFSLIASQGTLCAQYT
jgi:hypothetical protein